MITLMMEAVRTSETSVNIYLNKQQYIAEDSKLHGKYGPQDNMRQGAGRPTPGVAKPVVPTPKNVPEHGKYGPQDNMRHDVGNLSPMRLSSQRRHTIPTEAKTIVGKHYDMTPVSVQLWMSDLKNLLAVQQQVWRQCLSAVGLHSQKSFSSECVGF
jgi:hypothetical protein